jgi:hypothetical protein
MLHAISFFSIFTVYHRPQHMQMSLIILPEEQKCSQKEQINHCFSQALVLP